MKVIIVLAVTFLLSLSAIAANPAAPDPKMITLTESVETEYGVLGRGRQLPFVAREFAGEIAYVRVRYLDHELIVPLCSTNLHVDGDGEPKEPADSPRRIMVQEAMKKGQGTVQARNSTSTPKPVKMDQIAAGYSHAKSYVSRDDHDLVKIVDNLQGADSWRPSEEFRLGVVIGQWLVIDQLANNEAIKTINSQAAVSEALNFAKERFHEMRSIQKKFGLSDNLLFEAIHRDRDADAKRQFDLYLRWD